MIGRIKPQMMGTNMLRLWVVIHQMVMAYMIWRVMCGSGVLMRMMRIFTAIRRVGIRFRVLRVYQMRSITI